MGSVSPCHVPCVQLNEMIRSPAEGQFWQADHIQPVYSGGGQCSLENLQTLCTACHREVSMCTRNPSLLSHREQQRETALELLLSPAPSSAEPQCSRPLPPLQPRWKGSIKLLPYDTFLWIWEKAALINVCISPCCQLQSWTRVLTVG